MNFIVDRVLMSSQDGCEHLEVKVPHHRYIHKVLHEINHQIEQEGDRNWLVDTETGASYNISQIEGFSKSVASGLTKLGFGSGDVLQTGYSTCLDFYWPVFGAWLCGGTVSIADPNLTPDLIRHQLIDTKAKVVVCAMEFAEKYASVINEIQTEDGLAPILFVLDAETEADLPGTARSFQLLMTDGGEDAPTDATLPVFDPTERFIIFWSSGTTGTPKGIVHSHQNFHNFPHKSSNQIWVPGSHKTHFMTTMVGFHKVGFLIPLKKGIYEHCVVYLVKEKCFTAKNCLDMIAKYEAEALVCGLSHFIKISGLPKTKQQYPSMRLVYPIGGALSPGITEKALQILGKQTILVQALGSTEIGPVSFGTNMFEMGLLGKIYPGVKVYFADLETGEKVGPGQPGKIMVKNNWSKVEYLNRPEESAVFFDAEKFGFNGDIGHYDEAGNIYFDYRQSDLLKVDNYWFGPGEIESVLEGSDEIEEAMVWGEYDPGSGNDLVHVALVFTTTQGWPEQRVRDYAAERLPKTRHITGRIHVVKELPHTRQGKKLRRELKEKLCKNEN